MGKNQDKIAKSKLGRAGKLVSTGTKIGGNYLKHYARSLTGSGSQAQLDEDNAKDVYEAFNELKGGPLKLAQMLSMGDQILPKAYTMQFAQAQNKVKPLSYPLIRKTFKQETGKFPEEVFDTFSKDAVNAASIGQVHKGQIGEETFAIKIQYPGVADSLQSDIKMVTPVATKMLGLNKSDIKPYIKEVEQKLMEETDYEQELSQSIYITKACKHIEGLKFPKFKKKLSGKRVITMTWLDGLSLKEWIDTNPSQEKRNRIGQALWDFYQYQMHEIKLMHADPHPGNFIITSDNKLGVIDFGCVKDLPETFYQSYVKLIQFGQDLKSPEFLEAMVELDLIDLKAPEKEQKFILDNFGYMFSLVGKPLFSQSFDFGDDAYFKEIYEQGEALSKNNELKNVSAKGSNHFIYFNRTYFGLYQLLNQLRAKVNTDVYNRSMSNSTVIA